MYEKERSTAETVVPTKVVASRTDNASNHILTKDKNNVNSNKGEYKKYYI